MAKQLQFGVFYKYKIFLLDPRGSASAQAESSTPSQNIPSPFSIRYLFPIMCNPKSILSKINLFYLLLPSLFFSSLHGQKQVEKVGLSATWVGGCLDLNPETLRNGPSHFHILTPPPHLVLFLLCSFNHLLMILITFKQIMFVPMIWWCFGWWRCPLCSSWRTSVPFRPLTLPSPPLLTSFLCFAVSTLSWWAWSWSCWLCLCRWWSFILKKWPIELRQVDNIFQGTEKKYTFRGRLLAPTGALIMIVC